MIVSGSGVSITPAIEELRINISGDPISTGLSRENYISTFHGVIYGWKVVGSPTGSIVVDILKTYENLPSSFDSICGTQLPTLTNQTLNSDMQLTTWTDIHVKPGDVFGVNILSASDVTHVTVTILILQA